MSSFATHCLAVPRNVVVADDDLPLELLAPLGCAIQTGAAAVLRALAVPAGACVAVYGAGAAGMAAVMAAAVGGAATTVAVDLHASRLELAQELGATHAVRGDDDAVARQVRELTGGGAQYGLDTGRFPFDRLIRTSPLSKINEAGRDAASGAVVKPVLLPGEV